MSNRINDIENQFKEINEKLISQKDENPKEMLNSPLENINIFSRVFFLWVNRLLIKSHKKALNQDDIYQLQTKDKSQYNFEKFDKAYEDILKDEKIKNKMRATFFRIYKKEIAICIILYFINQSSYILLNLVFQKLLESFISPQRGESFLLILYPVLYFIGVSVLQSISKSNFNFYYSLLSVRITGAISMKIFQKTYCFPMQRNQFYKIGDILNMVQVDILQIVQYIQSLFQFALVFPFIGFSIYLCYDQIKEFIVVLVMSLCCFVTFVLCLILGKFYGSVQKKFMHLKDLRMRSLEEMMRGIKTIKYNSLETFFDQRIQQKREKELKQIRIQNFLVSINSFTSNISSVITILLITFLFGINSLGQLIMINNTYQILLAYLVFVPSQIQGIVVGFNSMKRVDNYLSESFVYQYQISDSDNNENISSDDFSIEINNGQFTWKNQIDVDKIQSSVKLSKRERLSLSSVEENTFQIRNLNLKIKKGVFFVFYGDLGSGKSSVLQAMLGEMEVYGGQESFQKMVKINGSISLCTQEPWVIQDTVKENILFGQQYDQSRYEQVLKVSCLDEDISYFVDGDSTNIGEKGETLSGGQRKRVNLARSIYREADIYILDDPLCALDIGVASFISKECIRGILKDKTRLVFTNNLVGMEQADRIFLVKEGEITQEGTYNQIRKIIAQEQNKIYDGEEEKKEIEQERRQSVNILQSSKKLKNFQIQSQNHTKKLIQTEDISQGYFKLEVFVEFIKNLGGFFFIFGILILIAGYILISYYSQIIVQEVKSDSTQEQQFKIMMLYCLYNAVKITSIFIYEIFIVFRMVSLSRYLHNSIVFSLLRASFTKFYNLITTGRLMNRLSKDIYEIDMLISKDIQTFISLVGTIVVCTITTMTLCNIKTISICIVYLFISALLTYYFVTAKRQVTRIEATSKSPILQYFSEIIRGIFYLRNCVKYANIKDNYKDYVDVDLRNQVALNGIQNWYEQITAVLCVIPLLSASFLVYFDMNMDANSCFIVVSQISTLCSTFIQFSNFYISYETHLVNFERCFRLKQNVLLENYETEEENHDKKNIQLNNSSIYQLNDDIEQASYASRQQLNYQQSIVFENASFQYRENLPNCLVNIDLTFQGSQKIGVVGRTGAGKTSITLALTKIIDLVQGNLLINGKPIQNYSLKELRDTISVVSQEPYIFEGSLKQNLDPYGTYSIEEINRVYESCGFSNCYSFQKGLDTQITLLGDNLSEGEKQLISIGRIILKKSKIIIVDEPTSHIDLHMEDHITKILNEYFKECMMITIAHKIKTIMDCDKILVLDHGKVQEFNNPQILLQDKHSLFSGIVNMINEKSIN
ncbi:ABC transporter family protein (macronuclear) [Tetrahymena thermophila SB210]|uniref:ABC transporter family protein n=1 Tax=Tetrahymena thermophila (strain SB210) TaxID=312017 RepID=Q23TU4_TETTS|nr:ABC transporter family protein [Tetrahymena thermophila SB210]EAR99951.2 ABC transporter family protein [Tetrahymena thermophila SB210]|eukprot:XP_001020196.2 ABC transporter family protein [Tetrahymena thermophila SB210]